MNIHEFQGKQLLERYGIPKPDGIVAKTPQEASAAFEKLGGSLAVVKAQIHAGGRGKGTIKSNPEQHGVELVRSAADAARVAEALIGNELVTIQTGPEGQTVKQVLVEAGCDIARELYLGIVVDRGEKKPVLMVSTEGGMDIEKVAEETPEKIYKQGFLPADGLAAADAKVLAGKLGLEGASVDAAVTFMQSICKLFVELDCSLAEINPLVVTGSGDIMALDAKVNFDDNALFRHKDVLEFRDTSEENPNELRAGEAGLSYVQLEGNIGCLVNGAGLAMSTMDLVNLHGGHPSNFLDVGGGANKDQVTEAFRILLGDKNVKAVLVNIFGGIMQCTTIANAVLAAYKEVGFNVPLVVRLEGTEVEEGRKILAESGVDIITAEGLTDAAKKVVAAAG
ncbi:Succinyl-CoA ligase [ADP-forming] subunit beta [Posidoniimonas polymericola]|uniref:Succinate--CoA ligase [ADP-forming] subunit beta n=1 Tax=Posidoniimonas polymericola TaxID=2528002 RepID=A0A5C5XWA9_9BACT|nr:ADP-forming succinate--CoA ligase subunit beta [Posidoniimonas polymericola]TWT67606.1 Succinyl-CoA ligase [ADP-forming] subunit beta [Posidoniimonas polymericola]